MPTRSTPRSRPACRAQCRWAALFAALGFACSAADARLLIFHRQLSDGPLSETQKTSISCQVSGLTFFGDIVLLHNGDIAAKHSPEISLDLWPAPHPAVSPLFLAMNLKCRVSGPNFDPPRLYHARLDVSTDFWNVPEMHDAPVHPAQDKRVVLVIEDHVTDDLNAPDGLRRTVRVRGGVSQEYADGSWLLLGSYRTRNMPEMQTAQEGLMW